MVQREYPTFMLTQEHYDKLPEYSMTIPACGPGKMEWKCNLNGKWLIGRYVVGDDGLWVCRMHEPVIVEEKKNEEEKP